jgi:hypothetical protein
MNHFYPNTGKCQLLSNQCDYEIVILELAAATAHLAPLDAQSA